MQAPRRLRRVDRLRRARDFRRVARDGHRVKAAAFTLVVASADPLSGALHARLGIAVSRHVGGAVVRNRIKRSTREWFRLRQERFTERVDLVVVAHPPAAGLSGMEIRSALDALAFSNLCGEQ